jgi:hypothetical protein
MLRVDGIFQNVPLRNPQVFQKLPGRMLRALRLLGAQFRRKIVYSSVEIRMRLSAAKQLNQLLP